jgi:hypothetical protein
VGRLGGLFVGMAAVNALQAAVVFRLARSGRRIDERAQSASGSPASA